MKRYIAVSLTALAAVWTAGAQNLNPTVEVTNQFEGKVMEVTKPVVDMAVPDSLLRFDLAFDYSVFDTPYKGTYEFSPYLLDMKPQPDAYRGSSLYLRLGAGYPLHPTADFVWSPELSGPFQVNVFGMHRSYVGGYKARLGDFGADYKGYDMLSRAGVDGRYDYTDGAFTFGAGYYGIHTKQDLVTAGYNAFDLKLGAQSLVSAANYFHYDVAAAFRGASQGNDISDNLNTVHFSLDATAGPVFDAGHALLIDAHVGIDAYSGLFSAHTGLMSVTPKYVLNADRWRISAGLRLAAVLRSEDEWMRYGLAGQQSQVIYPDVRVGYEAVADRLNLYVSATGGDHVWNYAELKEDNHFYNPYYGRGNAPLADNSVERIRLTAGVQGNVAAKFRYDFQTGWLFMANGLLDDVALYRDADDAYPGAPAVASPADGTWMHPAVTFEDYGLFFAKGTFAYDGRPVAVDGGFRFGRPTTVPLYRGFAPASTGWLKLSYNKMDRIMAGIRAEGALRRPGGSVYELMDLYIPGYLDLGLFGEYALTRSLSLWLRADNLLNANIQRHVLCPESGISVTGGIVFRL